MRRRALGAVCLAAAVALCGCLGPTTVGLTRSRYNEAVQTTGNEELLLNLVRLRYGEGVAFLPITSINAQFELDADAQIVGGISEAKRHLLGTGRLGFSDRPTLTFDPRRSPDVTRALLTRLDLETIDLLDAAGWDIGRLLRLLVENINGVGNAVTAGGPTPETAPEFAEYRHLAGLMQRLHDQRLAVLGVERQQADVPASVPFDALDAQAMVNIRKAGYGVRARDGKRGYVLTETKPVWGVRVAAEAFATADMAEVVRLLRLRPGRPFYEIRLSPGGQVRPTDPHEQLTTLTLTTRSLLEVMYFLSHAIAVPPEHVKGGLVTLTHHADGTPFDWGEVTGDLLRVLVCDRRPKRAAVAVKYRGHWFYIDDADVASKTTLALFRELTRLQKVGAAEGQPLLTLPVGR